MIQSYVASCAIVCEDCGSCPNFRLAGISQYIQTSFSGSSPTWVVCPATGLHSNPIDPEWNIKLLFFLWWLINFVVPTACLRSWAFKAANARAISIGDVQLEHQAWFISFLGVFNVATLAALWPRVPLVVCQGWAGCGEARRRMKRREAQSPGEYAVALEMLKNVISYPTCSIWSSGMLTVLMSAALHYSCDWVTIWNRPGTVGPLYTP